MKTYWGQEILSILTTIDILSGYNEFDNSYQDKRQNCMKQTKSHLKIVLLVYISSTIRDDYLVLQVYFLYKLTVWINSYYQYLSGERSASGYNY